MSNLRRDLILWSDTLQDFHLPRWEELPNFDLYLDQVITLIEGYLQNLFDEENDTILTAAMINNYVKLKLIPKAEKKRYNRMHIAYLIAITILKQVLTISEVKQGIEYQAGINGLKEAFNLFCEEQEAAIKAVADHLKNQDSTFLLEGITVQNTAIKNGNDVLCGQAGRRKDSASAKFLYCTIIKILCLFVSISPKSWLPSGNASFGHTKKRIHTDCRAIKVEFPF